ncbi:DUF5683 domain-containing protein [Flavobacterium sp. CBA20B-1]|uniref:DUF5683 domain-containing protein n=1 Tax=unclassified Flavobacterium TaxID=196869 RepID=UPI0022243C99|nr:MULTISPECIES: DUF5683 domain-containing protein [unclassified Flavobacterium]WCM42984.1 DUF5683 domain-containing protein [Flavobacterium sp. CBA20B-1]
MLRAQPQQIQLNQQAMDPLAPSKAAFYSAILPGLGQYYNKSYWKIPLVYGGLGTSMYFYLDNQKKYNRARDEYKLRLRGIDQTNNPKVGTYTEEQLLAVQRNAQRNRDLSLFITIGLYVLNIVDANVDAHLQQFNVDEDLTFKPVLEYNPLINQHLFNVNVSYRF